jgi:DMSO reductase family type II enzyme heme b subunit
VISNWHKRSKESGVSVMKVERIDSKDADLNDPNSAIWSGLTSETVTLAPVPLSAQPTEYIRVSRADRPYGETGQASATAVGSGDQLYVRLEWQDDEKPNSEFADAAAVILGSGSDIGTLGSDDVPLTLWYWADDRKEALSLSSRGPGVVRKNLDVSISAAANLDDNRWTVVLSGPAKDVSDSQLGIVIWNGTNDERAGLAAVSNWLSLDME